MNIHLFTLLDKLVAKRESLIFWKADLTMVDTLAEAVIKQMTDKYG